MLTGSPLSATYPTMPVPHGILISSFFSISVRVLLEQTSNSLETRQRPRGVCPGGRGVHPPPFSPWTRNREPRSACNNVDTFWRILWHNERTSNSLQMSFTCRERRKLRKNIRREGRIWVGHVLYFIFRRLAKITRLHMNSGRGMVSGGGRSRSGP
jgi:hypothetical protein